MILVDDAAGDHVRWIARSWEGVLERRIDGYAIDVKGREGTVRDAFDDPNQRVWLQVDDDQPIAMAVAALGRDPVDGTSILALVALWTAPKHRRKGHARLLLEAARRWGRAQGCERLTADVDTGDEASRRLLQGAGWAPARVHLVARL